MKRHFREMDVDIAATPFTVVGVGDMLGDVFGNGLLREKTTRKLIAAFDYRHAFSTIPTPMRNGRSSSASGCSICHVRAGRISTRR